MKDWIFFDWSSKGLKLRMIGQYRRVWFLFSNLEMSFGSNGISFSY